MLSLSSPLFLVIWLMAAQPGWTAKILMLPSNHYSHINFYAVAGKSLMASGHEVWMVTHELFGAKVLKSGMKSLTYQSNGLSELYTRLERVTPGILNGSNSQWDLFKELKGITTLFCESLDHNDIWEEVGKQKFDIVIIDGTPTARCMYVVPYRFSIPYISMCIMSDPWETGVPAMPSVEPIQALPFSDRMNFWQRTANTLSYVFMYALARATDMLGYDYVKSFAPDKPPISVNDLYLKSELWLVNLETKCLEFPRVSASHYQFIGGTSSRPAGPLPAELEAFVQGAQHGIIIMSFGSFKPFRYSMVAIIDKLLDAFSRVDQRVILQYDPTTLDASRIPPNVKCMPWLPQNDLLGHPKAVLFVTHGGNNGQSEAVYHGVPMLTLPLMGEQIHNGQRAEARGFGLMLDSTSFTAEEMATAIRTITGNTKYREKVQKCSEIIRSFPTASTILTFWVEHVLRFGGSHLRSASLDMSLFKFFSFDVLLFVTVCLNILIIVAFFLCRLCMRKLRKVCFRGEVKQKSA